MKLPYLCVTMSTHNEQPLEGAIKAFLRYYNLEHRIDEMKLINGWESVVGPMIAKHTMDLHIQRKTLYVKLDSDALRNELSYARSLVLKNLNDIVGTTVITDIVFR
ncbi:MAG: DUF721 domain-containing protein [Bacteroidales bacterium]|nr:DUF721 domain-containing protein [Bacteroidales bacterium]